MAKNSLKPLLGSLCMFGFEGTSIPDSLRHFIQEWQLGGVILFKRNLESKEQLQALIAEIRSLAQHPMLIAVDHEGGRVFRLPSPPFTRIPTARRLGEAWEEQDFESDDVAEPADLHPFAIGALMGQELREVGFNLNFAPVLDVDTHAQNPIIGDRAFSSNPELVAEMALELARGLRSQGVIPCGKHFPGHGDTAKDSHFDLPIVDQPLARLQAVEFLPFQRAAQASIEMLMTAHVVYLALDPENPATLSRKILHDLLRQAWGYQGVIISDDFLMKAIADRVGIPEAVVQFLKAGGDIPLICNQDEVQGQTLEFLEKAVRDEVLERSLLEMAQQRVSALKKKYLGWVGLQ